jgi:hypothetical protein
LATVLFPAGAERKPADYADALIDIDEPEDLRRVEAVVRLGLNP